MVEEGGGGASSDEVQAHHHHHHHHRPPGLRRTLSAQCASVRVCTCAYKGSIVMGLVSVFWGERRREAIPSHT